jgi:hypothetical protein
MIDDAREIFGIEPSPDNAALLEALGILPADRAARIIASASPGRDHAQAWTQETVKRRLIVAAELIERTSRGVGPNRRITAWVDWRLFRGVTDFERNAMAEGVAEGTRWPDRSHGRYVAFQMAEVAITRNLFGDILRMIADLRPPPVTLTA